jgi:ubiquinone/menaquinone biosynthesis C-methylase UbiE
MSERVDRIGRRSGRSRRARVGSVKYFAPVGGRLELGPRMTPSDLPQFHELAPYYDALNDWKDYRAESQRLEHIARRYGRRGRTSWLDVACGTGRHLEYLRRRHAVVGIDGSRDMLRLARRRLPGVRLVLGDMRTFRLPRRFDVVSCLFSAIGHLRTKEDVRTAFANFGRHLNPGGVAIVEPWIEPSAFRAGKIHLRTHESPTLTAVRFAFSSRRRNLSRIHYHFLIGRPGQEIRHFEETDVKPLLSRDSLTRLMERAGLQPRFLSHGFMRDRGLLLGVKAEG